MSNTKKQVTINITNYDHYSHHYQYGQYGCSKKPVYLDVPRDAHFSGVINTAQGQVWIAGEYDSCATHNTVKVLDYRLLGECNFDMSIYTEPYAHNPYRSAPRPMTFTHSILEWGIVSWIE